MKIYTKINGKNTRTLSTMDQMNTDHKESKNMMIYTKSSQLQKNFSSLFMV